MMKLVLIVAVSMLVGMWLNRQYPAILQAVPLVSA